MRICRRGRWRRRCWWGRCSRVLSLSRNGCRCNLPICCQWRSRSGRNIYCHCHGPYNCRSYCRIGHHSHIPYSCLSSCRIVRRRLYPRMSRNGRRCVRYHISLSLSPNCYTYIGNELQKASPMTRIEQLWQEYAWFYLLSWLGRVFTTKIEVSDDFCKECIGNVSLWKVICGEKQLKTAIFREKRVGCCEK